VSRSSISKRVPFLILADLAAISTVVFLESFFKGVNFSIWILKPYFFIVILILFPLLFYIFDLYYPYKLFKPGLTFFEITTSVLAGALILAALSYADRSFILPRKVFFITLLPIAPLIFRIRMLYDGLFKTRFLDKRALVIGTGPLARDLVKILDQTPHSGLLLVGVVSSAVKGEARSGEIVGRVPVLGSREELSAIMVSQKAQIVIMALEAGEKETEVQILAELFRRRFPVTSATHLLERLTGAVPRQVAADSHLVLGFMADVRVRPYLKLKRVLDIVIATLLLIGFAPIWLVAVLLLALTGPHEIFFIQERIGLHGVPFQLIKLRSMTTSQKGRMVVTRLGKWLRRHRIDEIPQLLNVIRGDMSLVGPRPEIPYFVERSLAKIPMYEAVFSAKPGLTGWAQVKFRYTTSTKDYYEKFRYNLFYLKNMSLVLDILILFKTVRIVMFGLGK
jgi:exopolysaccharide biosynthesis polyprenyl glycosylphosphotransferase